jgi:hypothetical protein
MLDLLRTNLLGDPPVSSVRQQNFDIFGGVFHSLFMF